MNNISLYIHIPFCHKAKCLYCDFVSFCGQEKQIDGYVSALCREFSLYKKTLSNSTVSTIFIGGGTPSLLSTHQIKKIFVSLSKNFVISKNAEITIECNPESIKEDRLKCYKALGINRLSLGCQTMNDSVLSLIGRQHRKKHFEKALALSQKYFDNINVDMMIGLPSQSLNDVMSMAEYLVQKGIPHISAYSLMLEEKTPLCALVSKGEIKLPSDDQTVKMYDKLSKYLAQNGIKRYEVSNFALKGKECLHNLNYWTMGEYIGFGVAAHSYFEGKRFCNTSSMQEYIDRLSLATLPIDSSETLSNEQTREEYIMLSLRTKWGINLAKYKEMFGASILDQKRKEIDMLLSQKLVKLTPSTLSLTSKGYHVLNAVVLSLC